ncbi:MAG: thermonuclease family protein [Nannocystaceae bacterium]
MPVAVPKDRRIAAPPKSPPRPRAAGDARPLALLLALTIVSVSACDDDGPYAPPPESNTECGPAHATVVRAVDGDTIDLDTGDRVRYLMIDTPESTQGKIDCYGEEAHEYNARLVEGQEVDLYYDEQCRDTYGRLLAYVHTDAGEVNRILIRQGYACFYSIPPNGYERIDEFRALEREASVLHSGLWGACSVVTCQH